MIELSSRKKSKIRLEEYNYQKDIKIRKTLVELSPLAIELIDEILYSKRTMSIWKLAQSVEAVSEEIIPILQELEKLGLLTLSETEITTHKEAKKYFEYEILRFSEDFRPDLFFFQALLKHLPIHILPNWYQIPKSSNHIFQSIVEKYLYTPQLYQRHLIEVKADGVLSAIIDQLADGAVDQIPTKELQESLQISDEELYEAILYLEYNFICFAKYVQKNGKWEEYLVPLYEWRQFLSSKKSLPFIPYVEEIEIKEERAFGFIQDLTAYLQGEETLLSNKAQELQTIANQLHFINDKKELQKTGIEWLALANEEKSLYLFQHRHLFFPYSNVGERAICEAEKSVREVIGKGWIPFEQFLSFAEIALDNSTKIILESKGRLYRYVYPEYTQEQKEFIHAAIFGNLYKMGMVSIGCWKGKDCFMVTPFGEKFFAL